ncbi:MAG: efflux RND transporter periplasmic adaptor subunit [Propylenella sp.]
MVWFRRIVLLLVAAAVVAGIVYALAPKPVAVDLANVDRGVIEVTVDEEGVARIRDVYRVSAPMSDYLDRFPLEVGDTVKRGETVVAEIRPTAPSFLDVRSRRELEAASGAAAAAVRLAEAELSRSQAELRLAEADLQRAKRLSESGTISARAMDEAMSGSETARAQVEQAEATLALRINERESAEARLIEPNADDDLSSATCCVLVRAPVDGVVLKVHAESAQVVSAGALIAEIGDPGDMEVMVDLLSTDAVQVMPGAAARVEGWGGAEALTAGVRRIEPSAFTKVSALGIEEQRVNVLLDLNDQRSAWERLGHEFRVFVRIRVWRGEDVVRVPLAALFRRGPQWSVFKVVDGRAVLTPVTIDHRDSVFAEVTDGLAQGDVVVLHPSDQVEGGVSVEPREGT